MNRETLTAYIVETYSVEPDRPWARYPDYEVFRHGGNRKWFAVLLRVSRKTLGLEGDGMLDIVNVKGDPLLIGSLRGGPGIYPAYHMSKGNWLSVAPEEAEEETLRLLLDRSFCQTAPKGRRRKGGSPP